MHEQGWHYLAKQNTAVARVLVRKNALSNRYDNVLALVHVAGCALALKEGNIPYVATEVRALGTAMNQGWLIELGDATQDVYEGAQAKAITKLKKLQNHPDLSATERVGVGKVLDAATAGSQDVSMAVANAVMSVVYDIGIQSNPLTPYILKELPEKYRKKLAKYL